MSNITDWIKEELYPNLFDKIDSAFPEHNFKSYSGGWKSNTYLNGELHPSRSDKTVITKKAPGVILEQGGEVLSLVDYVIKRDAVDLLTAVNKLANMAGIDTPSLSDDGSFSDYKQRTSLLEACNSYFVYCLNKSSNAKSTIDYLSKRGYSAEDIEAMELGFIPSQEKLTAYLESRNYTVQEIEKYLSINNDSRIGTTHVLTIPYRAGGQIKGFKFRTVSEEVKPKYLNNKGLDRSSSFFNLKPAKGDKDIIIVEGELDALHATIKGIDNVVATGGNSVTVDQINEALRVGAKKFTIAFDNEPNKIEENINKVNTVIKVILNTGVNNIYIAELTNSADDKLDIDTYLNKFGVESLLKDINAAKPYYLFLLDGVVLKYAKLALVNEDQLLTSKQLDNLLAEIIETGATISDPIHKDLYKNTFLKLGPIQELGITNESLDAVLDNLTYTKEKAQKESAFRDLILQVSKSTDVDGAIDLIETGLGNIKLTDKKTSFEKLTIPISEETLIKSLSEKSESLSSGFKIDGQEILIPSGAITAIAAPTSHGKTTMLINLALNVVKEYNDKEFYFFSYEEDRESILINTLNSYIGDTLSYNNRNSINSYFTKNTLDYIFREKRDSFIAHKDEFFKEIIQSRRLNIQYVNYDIDTLIEAIRFLKKNTNVGGIFIDYIQLLSLPVGKHKTYSRQEELKNICLSLKDVAVETGLPIILGAQFNREVTNHLKIHATKIGEAGDIERIANLIIGMWNNYFKPLGSEGDKDVKEIRDRGIDAPNTLYAKVLKYRGGQPGGDGLLQFNGNTSRIESSSPIVNPF